MSLRPRWRHRSAHPGHPRSRRHRHAGCYSHLQVRSSPNSESVTVGLVGPDDIPESNGGHTINARLMGRPARAAAALGALVAAGAVTLVATVGTANAAGA